MNAAKKNLLFFIFGGLFLSLISLLIWIHVNNNQKEIFLFGKVQEISEGSLVLSDRDGKRTEVLITPETKIRKHGKDVRLKNIPVNQFVQISGVAIDREKFQANTVRLFQEYSEKERS